MPGAVLAGSQAWWREQGQGAREMLFLHCSLAHSGAWKGVLDQLDDLAHMRAMDLPGHGRSGPRDPSRSWQRQSADMAIALIEKGGQPVDLVGHSFGATVCLRIAHDRPDLARSLTLIEPVFFSAARDAGRPEFAAHLVENAAVYELLDKGDLEGAARAFTKLWGGGVPWEMLPVEQRQYMTDRISIVREGGDSVLGEGPDYIPLERIRQMDLPVLLIDGERTDPIIHAVQETLQENFPDVRRVTVAGAGHMVPITHPREVANAVRAFLEAPADQAVAASFSGS